MSTNIEDLCKEIYGDESAWLGMMDARHEEVIWETDPPSPWGGELADAEILWRAYLLIRDLRKELSALHEPCNMTHCRICLLINEKLPFIPIPE